MGCLFWLHQNGLHFFSFSFLTILYFFYRDFNLTWIICIIYVLGTLLSKLLHLMSLVMSGNIILITTHSKLVIYDHIFLISLFKFSLQNFHLISKLEYEGEWLQWMAVSLSCFWHSFNTQQPPKDRGNQNKSVLYIFFPWPMHLREVIKALLTIFNCKLE